MSWVSPQAVAVQLGGVLPRSVSALRRTSGWSPVTPTGARLLGEVMFDELVLAGMTLMGGTPAALHPPDVYAAAAEELSALGLDGAHGDPAPLRVAELTRHRFGGTRYERITFDHEPVLPPALTAAGMAGPATAGAHLLRRDGDRPWLVWIHGAGQGGPGDLLAARAGRVFGSLGFNVALPIQPGHGFRKRAWPGYPDMEPLSNVAGMMRSVSEVRALVRWLSEGSNTVVVLGVSLGSPIAALVSHLEPAVHAVAVYTPILGLNKMIAHHLDRFGTAGADARSLLVSDVVTTLTSVVDPLATLPAPPPQRRLIVGARNDRMAMPDPAFALHERWGGQLYWYDGSHAGHLFSRKVQTATERFLRAVTA